MNFFFAQTFDRLEQEEDINRIHDYFSYEHFYVIYCKFWELDADHDLFISRDDLAKHSNGGKCLKLNLNKNIFLFSNFE